MLAARGARETNGKVELIQEDEVKSRLSLQARRIIWQSLVGAGILTAIWSLLPVW